MSSCKGPRVWKFLLLYKGNMRDPVSLPYLGYDLSYSFVKMSPLEETR